MNQKKNRLSSKQDSEKVALELYKTAFARLNFQDEYLFKFSTVFLTAHGALAVLAGSAVFRSELPSYSALAVVSAIGLFLALVWSLWTHHNDYWHSVWTGVLRQIEGCLVSKARVFDLDHDTLARKGNRCKPKWLTGHRIAQLVPVVLFLGWLLTLLTALCK